jgi:hypothetical protein
VVNTFGKYRNNFIIRNYELEIRNAMQFGELLMTNTNYFGAHVSRKQALYYRLRDRRLLNTKQQTPNNKTPNPKQFLL